MEIRVSNVFGINLLYIKGLKIIFVDRILPYVDVDLLLKNDFPHSKGSKNWIKNT